MNYHPLYSIESHGTYGFHGIKIDVAAHPKLPDLKNDSIQEATHKAAAIIEDALMRRVIAENPDAQERAKNNREMILGFFALPIFAKEIPNGYCNRWCCAHLPWLIVTTQVGDIKIGWRKSVINIDWSATKDTCTAGVLFPNEDVTKEDRLIHAWSQEKAKAYIHAILTGIPLAQNNSQNSIDAPCPAC